MTSTPFQLQSAGQQFFAKHWPVDNAKAVFCIIHGHGEHILRYEHVAAFLNQAGIAVMGHDLHGHGQTNSKKGHFPSYEAVLDSIDVLLAEAANTYPSLPIFMLGHSMGGNLVANHLLKRKPDLAGAILTGPYFRLAFEPSKVDLFLAKVMMKIYPSFTQSSKLDAQGLSHDPTIIQAYIDDPLVHDLVSPVLFSTVSNGGEYALAHANELTIPTLLMHGSEDPITSYPASEAFAKKAGKMVTWKPWEGMFHEIHNEVEKEQVLAYMLSWIEKQLVATA